MNYTVDVISDVICPWCYIGKRRLERAIATLGEPVRVRWLPFQMNPVMPREGITRKEYRTRKFGTWERSLELDAEVTAAGRGEGIEFAFDRIERTPNTLDAHRLIWLAERKGIQDAVVEGLFHAYFVACRDISHPQVLRDVVAEAGLDRSEAESALNGNDGLAAIHEAALLSEQLGVPSVPFFVFNGRLPLYGAQQPAVLLDAWKKASR